MQYYSVVSAIRRKTFVLCQVDVTHNNDRDQHRRSAADFVVHRNENEGACSRRNHTVLVLAVSPNALMDCSVPTEAEEKIWIVHQLRCFTGCFIKPLSEEVDIDAWAD